MKTLFSFSIGMVLIGMLFLGGCSSDSSPTQAAAAADSGTIEGQLVADSGATVAKLSTSPTPRDVGDPSVYPVSGATVELLQDGVVIATTTTDEYGRFQFTGLAEGNYEVRSTAGDGSVANYQVFVNADQTITVYGRVMSGECYWGQENGPHWNNMPNGPYWGQGFQGASPGTGYWHDGQGWCEPQGTGPQGTGPQGTGPYGPHR